jgi:mannan endo-1,4-beta-mannosidase
MFRKFFEPVLPSNYSGFRVKGRHIYDGEGEQVILRGINKMTVWTDRDGIPSFAEIEKTGANSVRIVWTAAEGSPQELAAAVERCLEYKMIPMPELHDATGAWEKLDICVDWWCKPEVVSLIKKYEKYLLLNIANECGNDDITNEQFRAAYGAAVAKMRAAGIRVPLVIDGTGWGRNIDILRDNGDFLIDLDPLHNLILSVHMWWMGYPSIKIEDEIKRSVESGLPIIIGEFSKPGPFTDVPIDYSAIMEFSQKYAMSWIVWEWGPGNLDSPLMDMTEDGTIATLGKKSGTGWARDIVFDSPYSIRNTSLRPNSIMRYGI